MEYTDVCHLVLYDETNSDLNLHARYTCSEEIRASVCAERRGLPAQIWGYNDRMYKH